MCDVRKTDLRAQLPRRGGGGVEWSGDPWVAPGRDHSASPWFATKGTRGDAGTYPSHQRWFLPVSATLLRSYRYAVSRDERHCAASASHSGETQGEASQPYPTPPPPLRGRAYIITDVGRKNSVGMQCIAPLRAVLVYHQ